MLLSLHPSDVTYMKFIFLRDYKFRKQHFELIVIFELVISTSEYIVIAKLSVCWSELSDIGNGTSPGNIGPGVFKSKLRIPQKAFRKRDVMKWLIYLTQP